ncbi:phospholipase A [Chitinasiproducens palmae]|uniref:phospholipase A n=1 Tax=Chitinasiproducens palmae TaxID=1770053 RepID=UPI001F3A52E5|nr:phospholipase A [Chitinasiproducens palmae]
MLATTALAAAGARADVAVVQPPAVVAADQPLTVTLVFSHDDANGRVQRFDVPPTIAVAVQQGDSEAVQTVTLQRAGNAPAQLALHTGGFRKVAYTASWPDRLRGAVRVQVAGYNTAPALVTLDRGRRQDETVADNQAQRETAPPPAGIAAAPEAASGAAVAAAGAPVATTAGAQPLPESRLSFYEPFYVGVGRNGDTNARFQLSFKYRVIMPADPRSRALFDNLYFGYTQTSIWDLSAESRPFRDTSYKPSLFYYVPDLGIKSSWFESLGVQAGLEHESNGRSGERSRSINTAYVQPIVRFAMPAATQLTLMPKFYYYLQKSENPDIMAYRGFADLTFKYGRPDALELRTTLRKGNHAWNGSVDAQLTYPLQKLLGGAWGGYLWLGYFNGYGEDLLDYNGRQHWNVRIGYSIAR